MKVGDLVKIKRISIGVPLDTMGLIINIVEPGDISSNYGYGDIVYYIIQITNKKIGVKQRRYLKGDLELVNEAG